jgi:hypothetical protein
MFAPPLQQLTGQCYVAVDVLTAMVMESSIFWDKTLCSLLKVKQHFGSALYLLHAGFLLQLFVSPENRGDMFLRNVS